MLDRQWIPKLAAKPEDRLLLSHALDKAEASLKNHEMTFTGFLDPRRAGFVLEAVKYSNSLTAMAYGGNEQTERRIIGFCPDYMVLEKEDFPITAIRMTINQKFSNSLSHRDYLGSILGLGIDRSKVGDILLYEDSTISYVCTDIADYICANLRKIARTKVELEAFQAEAYKLPEDKTDMVFATVPSLRLDAVVGTAFHISRGKAQELIQGEKVFVNWAVITHSDFKISEGDLISIRGFGRVKLAEINGLTKKERISITICKYV